MTPGVLAVRQFQRCVRSYFRRHGRDLPWRHTTDPYCILVSEIMLQQTQVDRVVDKYTGFIARFPSVQELAAAPLQEVLACWIGLGYNRRALMLSRLAQTVCRDFSGRIPDQPEQLVQLPGIGPATAASIAAFGFNRPTVFIETNIRAVFIHHFFKDQQEVRDEQIRSLVELTLDRRNPRQWYSALMDYGTSLKKLHANPARRSAHHVHQSPFEGSDRQIRGAVIRLLLHKPGSALTLQKACAVNAARLDPILQALISEGLICRIRRTYHIAPPQPKEIS